MSEENLTSQDKEELKRRLELLQKEYERTAQRLQRAERREAVRKHVQNTVMRQNRVLHINTSPVLDWSSSSPPPPPPPPPLPNNLNVPSDTTKVRFCLPDVSPFSALTCNPTPPRTHRLRSKRSRLRLQVKESDAEESQERTGEGMEERRSEESVETESEHGGWDEDVERGRSEEKNTEETETLTVTAAESPRLNQPPLTNPSEGNLPPEDQSAVRISPSASSDGSDPSTPSAGQSCSARVNVSGSCSILTSCTLIEGLPFPVEYYVRTTRLMASAHSSVDLNAVIQSQLSNGRGRRRSHRGRAAAQPLSEKPPEPNGRGKRSQRGRRGRRRTRESHSSAQSEPRSPPSLPREEPEPVPSPKPSSDPAPESRSHLGAKESQVYPMFRRRRGQAGVSQIPVHNNDSSHLLSSLTSLAQALRTKDFRNLSALLTKLDVQDFHLPDDEFGQLKLERLCSSCSNVGSLVYNTAFKKTWGANTSGCDQVEHEEVVLSSVAQSDSLESDLPLMGNVDQSETQDCKQEVKHTQQIRSHDPPVSSRLTLNLSMSLTSHTQADHNLSVISLGPTPNELSTSPPSELTPLPPTSDHHAASNTSTPTNASSQITCVSVHQGCDASEHTYSRTYSADVSTMEIQTPEQVNNPPLSHHDSPPSHHDSPLSHHDSPPSHHDSPLSHHDSPPSHHDSPPSQNNPPLSHHDSPPSHHDSPLSNHDSPLSHHDSPPSHHDSPPSQNNPPLSHHDSPPSHHDSPPSQNNPPLSHHDSPPSHHDSPLSHHDSPLSHHDSPPSQNNPPLSHHDSPLSHHDSPLSHHDSPPSQNNPPLSHHDSPLSHHDSPPSHHDSPPSQNNPPLSHHDSPPSHHDSPPSQNNPPLSHHDSPPSHHDSPLSHHDSPLSHHDSPPSQNNPPLSHHDSPLSHHDSPLSHHDSPPSQNNPPLSHHDSPLSHHDSPPSHHDSPPSQNNPPLSHHDSPPSHHDSPPSQNNPPLSHHDSPPSHHDSPLSHHDSPLSHHDSPPSQNNPPLSHHDSPLSHHDSPLSHHDSPPSQNNPPLSHHDSPPSQKNSPFSHHDSPPSQNNPPLSHRDSTDVALSQNIPRQNEHWISPNEDAVSHNEGLSPSEHPLSLNTACLSENTACLSENTACLSENTATVSQNISSPSQTSFSHNAPLSECTLNTLYPGEKCTISQRDFHSQNTTSRTPPHVNIDTETSALPGVSANQGEDILGFDLVQTHTGDGSQVDQQVDILSRGTLRKTHTLKALDGGCVLDVCVVRWPPEDWGVCVAGEWSVCVWKQNSGDQEWSLLYTWTFTQSVISLQEIPDSSSLLCVCLGTLEITEARILYCPGSDSRFSQVELYKGSLQAVLAASERRVTCCSSPGPQQNVQVFTLTQDGRITDTLSLVSTCHSVQSLALVQDQKDALIGWTEHKSLLLWNMKSGQLLQTIRLDETVSTATCLRGYAYKGSLCVLLQQASVCHEASTSTLFTVIATNPLTRKCFTLYTITSPSATTERMIDGDVCESALVGVFQSALWIWNLSGGVACVYANEPDQACRLVRWAGPNTLLTGYLSGDVSVYEFTPTDSSRAELQQGGVTAGRSYSRAELQQR